ncbi:MAG: dipeptide epimerase [Longimicrobiales bacterium]
MTTRHEFHIARAAAPSVRRNVWVRLEDSDGLDGWGEAAPNAYYAESVETVVAALEQMRPVLDPVHTFKVDGLALIERDLASAARDAASARAAVSAALLDMLGKRSARPVYHVLGMDPAQAPASSYTIGIDHLDAMRDKVRAATNYPILKIKVGTAQDEAVLSMLREERPDAVIRVDANTAWSRDTALRNLAVLSSYGVELIEQPLPADDWEGMARLRRVTDIPIIADESCRFEGDVERLHGCVDGVNIKLAKCGSLLEAMRIAAAARQRDMSVMVGCMIESTLGIAAGIQLAPLADYADLDGAALLARDYFNGPGLEANGRLRFNRGPGLGVTAI